MEFFLIGLGGGLGAATRFSLGKYIKGKINIHFPLNTMIINILGSFLLGISVVNTKNPSLAFFIQSGFLGGFTTFSTFMLEGFNLYKVADFYKSIFYLSTSVLLGAISFLIAFHIKF
ncbi:MAG: CrcB family protein [Peptostreptococcus sp.]|uniref:fluoride efflux transporter FluC n=1 Tax=Peptostreptococcus sp. TaxID=1262 RepID=UPI002FCC4E34